MDRRPEPRSRSTSQSKSRSRGSSQSAAASAWQPSPHLLALSRGSSPAAGGPAGGGARLEQVVSALNAGVVEHEQQRRPRSAQVLKIRIAREYMRAEAWDQCLRVLRTLWVAMLFRAEGWWDVVEEVCWALRAVAARTGDGATVVAVDWELMHSGESRARRSSWTFRRYSCIRSFTDITVDFSPKPDWQYNIARCLDGLEPVTHKLAIVIREQDVHSFLSATFAFDCGEGKVGESCSAQLTVWSTALATSTPVTMTEVKISFEGSMRPVFLKHQAADPAEDTSTETTHYSKVALRDGSAADGRPSSRDPRFGPLVGEANLTFAPGTTTVFEFYCPLKEPGDARANSATFSMSTERFDLDFVANLDRPSSSVAWWSQKSRKRRVVRENPHALHIQPRPPKMDMRFVAMHEEYYTDEPITLQLDITNNEDDESIAKLIVNVTGPGAPPFVLKAAGSSEELDLDAAEEGMSYVELGKIESSGSTTTFIELSHGSIPSVYDVAVELLYHLVSDKETPISRKLSVHLELVSPFEANYDFSPRLDRAPWPSFFSPSEADGYEDTSIGPSASGLAQKWCLTTRYASFALEPLIIEEVSLDIMSLNGGITCSASKAATEVVTPSKVVIQPRSIEECLFTVLTRKLSLDDRRSASLDLSLVVKWRRASSPTPISPPTTARAMVNTTRLPVPRLLVASSEPRVLATVVYSRLFPSLIHLSYTIENSSMHFLTFGVAMNASENFAFSGPKQATVQLLPLSRRTLCFALLPVVRGAWVRVGFVVRDRYFQKVLRILVTEGMRSDKEGVMVWVPPDED